MIYNGDTNLTKNFKLKEVVGWPDRLPGMSKGDKQKARELAMTALTTQTLANAVHQAIRLQIVRNEVNEWLRQIGCDFSIYILVTCWLRHIQWEEYRGRDGSSIHTKGDATDIVLVGAPTPELHDKVMGKAFEKLKVLPGFTQRYDTFIHNDQRGLV